MPNSRHYRGKRNDQAGRAAEEAVARHYENLGLTPAVRRWRGQAGEIDLICRAGAEVIFVEVKSARDHATAASRLSARQMTRILTAGAEFLADEPAGELTPCRFDVALVDQIGRVHILENALTA